jgi:hypothetical protein
MVTARPICIRPTPSNPNPASRFPATRHTPVDLAAPRLHAAIQRKADAFFKTMHTAPVSAPMNPERFPSTDVTPKFELGVGRTAYDINGELMVKVSVLSPNAQPIWFDLGKMPRA